MCVYRGNAGAGCFPETKYLGWDDHAVTNIAGATVSAMVLPYQMGGAGGFGKDTEEHKPIVATLQLPTPCSSNATDPNVCAPERYGEPMCFEKTSTSCCQNDVHGTAILCAKTATPSAGCCLGGARASRIGFCCNASTTCCGGDYYDTPGSCCGAGTRRAERKGSRKSLPRS